VSVKNGEVTPRNRSDDRNPVQRPLLTYQEAHAYSGISERYLRRLRAERRIGVVKIGRRVFLDPTELDTIIESGREPAIREAR
jgi:excisionase family DNA binding protein